MPPTGSVTWSQAACSRMPWPWCAYLHHIAWQPGHFPGHKSPKVALFRHQHQTGCIQLSLSRLLAHACQKMSALSNGHNKYQLATPNNL